MNAKEMFRCLGYQIVRSTSNKHILYEKTITDYVLIDEDDENYDDWKKCSYKHYLSFDLASNSFTAYSHDYLNCCEDYLLKINAMELKAIIQQCKELGWLDD